MNLENDLAYFGNCNCNFFFFEGGIVIVNYLKKKKKTLNSPSKPITITVWDVSFITDLGLKWFQI